MDGSKRQRMFQRWGRDAPTLESADFLTQAEAAHQLGVGEGMIGIGSLIMRRILEPAFLSDGSEGVTLRSVEAELVWRADATMWRKLGRGVTSVRHFV